MLTEIKVSPRILSVGGDPSATSLHLLLSRQTDTLYWNNTNSAWQVFDTENVADYVITMPKRGPGYFALSYDEVSVGIAGVPIFTLAYEEPTCVSPPIAQGFFGLSASDIEPRFFVPPSAGCF